MNFGVLDHMIVLKCIIIMTIYQLNELGALSELNNPIQSYVTLQNSCIEIPI